MAAIHQDNVSQVPLTISIHPPVSMPVDLLSCYSEELTTFLAEASSFQSFTRTYRLLLTPLNSPLFLHIIHFSLSAGSFLSASNPDDTSPSDKVGRGVVLNLLLVSAVPQCSPSLGEQSPFLVCWVSSLSNLASSGFLPDRSADCSCQIYHLPQHAWWSPLVIHLPFTLHVFILRVLTAAFGSGSFSSLWNTLLLLASEPPPFPGFPPLPFFSQVLDPLLLPYLCQWKHSKKSHRSEYWLDDNSKVYILSPDLFLNSTSVYAPVKPECLKGTADLLCSEPSPEYLPTPLLAPTSTSSRILHLRNDSSILLVFQITPWVSFFDSTLSVLPTAGSSVSPKGCSS